MDIQQLIWELQNGNDQQRRAASYKLAKSKDPLAVPALIKAYNDQDGSVRQNVIRGLRNIGSKEAIEFLNLEEERRRSFITEESLSWRPIIESRLMPSEQLIDVMGYLSFSLYFVPQVNPFGDYQTSLAGTLALTTHRIIAILAQEEAQSWKWFHVSAINSLCERPFHPDKPSWPYQAVLMIPGGMGLVVQTRTTYEEDCNRLSSLLLDLVLQASFLTSQPSPIKKLIVG